MFYFLFHTWLGGVVCMIIALCIAGPIIMAQVNKAKAFAKKEVEELRQRLHHANQNATNQSNRH